MFNRRIILISIENFNREYLGKSFLSKKLSEEGYIVFLAHKSIIRTLIKLLPLKEDIFIGKGNRMRSIKHFKRSKENKLFNYTFDEESLMQSDFENYIKRNHDINSIKYIDGVFSWGDVHTKLLRYAGFSEGKIIKTGNPRFDYCISNRINNQKRKDANPYILICSRFASANPNRITNRIEDQRDSSEEYLNDSRKMLNELILLPKLIRSSNITDPILVRPHQSESKDLWIKATHGLKNINIDCSESISKVLMNAKVLIHNRCTTAIEAFLSGVPVLSYEPFDLKSPPSPNKDFTNSFSNQICKSNQELIESLKIEHLTKPSININEKKEIEKYLYSFINTSSDKIKEYMKTNHPPNKAKGNINLLLIIIMIPIIFMKLFIIRFYYLLFNRKHLNYINQKNGSTPMVKIINYYQNSYMIRVLPDLDIYLPFNN